MHSATVADLEADLEAELDTEINVMRSLRGETGLFITTP